VQDVDRPAEVEALAAPARAPPPCVDRQAARSIRRDQRPDRVGRHRRRRRDFEDRSAARRAEVERPVGVPLDLVALLVDGFPRQVFFPMADEGGGWARLARNLKAEIDEERIEAYRGIESLKVVSTP